MDVSHHRYPYVILIPLFLSLFLSSFGYKRGFEAKAAFVPSRFVHLPTNLPASTYNLSIYTDIPLEIKMPNMRTSVLQSL